MVVTCELLVCCMHGIKSVSVRLMFAPKIHKPINHVLRQLPRRPSMISVVKIFLFFGLLIFYLYLSFIYIYILLFLFFTFRGHIWKFWSKKVKCQAHDLISVSSDRKNGRRVFFATLRYIEGVYRQCLNIWC